MIDISLQKARQQERRAFKLAVLITAIIISLMVIVSMVWDALPWFYPKPEEKVYTAVGKIDFGNQTEGSSNVNNFMDPSPVPADKPKTEPKKNPEPVENSAPKSDPILTKPDPSEVKANPTSSSTDGSGTQTTTSENNSSEELDAYDPGGSNHGDGSDVGNRGTNVNVLDPDGTYGFGDGGNGLGNRKALDLPKPRYTSQEEGRVTFVFTIAPNGSVRTVRALPSPFRDLKRAGIQAIRKWKFEPKDPSYGDQEVTVAINFRLK